MAWLETQMEYRTGKRSSEGGRKSVTLVETAIFGWWIAGMHRLGGSKMFRSDNKQSTPVDKMQRRASRTQSMPTGTLITSNDGVGATEMTWRERRYSAALNQGRIIVVAN